ncbi:acetyltransferase [Sporolactobacillus shoreicorticis]|uniref:Acyltransferase family protein n=1 Tax=Sporolactobacillus shoreicorticis TaxID=1923877 RepID=A0ABW5S872_9BACL|nr:acyltransferase family protein [Sporolactobacillus shoreicorticis]MCO7126877.1 acetyltransferase [Sporolactobacillus shoreicorticis]
MEYKQKHRYMGGLDGLRALSVLVVMAYHMNLPFAGGGFLGVGIFFVISGYLITDLLIQEWEDTNSIDLKKFWVRRAKRLLPAMISVLVVILGYVIFFQPALLRETRMDAVAALFYYSNWWSVFHQQSYFDSFANPSLLKHFWSLAIEEQFYLLWPLIVTVALRIGKGTKVLYGLTLLLAASSILCMGLIYHTGTDPSRVYYGTDSRAFALLFGAILACVWPSRHLNGSGSRALGIFLDGIGTLALISLFLCVVYVNQYEEFLYTGGLALFSLVSVVLITALAHPATLIGKWAGIRPLRWIGLRSYGMYLWHYPIIQLTTPASQVNEVHPLRIVLQLVLVFSVSALSYHFIECPIRRLGKTGHWRRIIRNASVGLCVLFLIFYGSSFLAHQTDAKPAFNENVTENAQGKKNSGEKQPTENTKNEKTSASKVNGSALSNHSKQTKKKSKPNEKNKQPKKQAVKKAVKEEKQEKQNKTTAKEKTAKTQSQVIDKQVTAIGDSVMLGAEPYLKKEIKQLTIDCKVGRQFQEAFNTVNQLKQQGKLKQTVVIELGTNGPFTQEQMDELIGLIGSDKNIILINTRVPRQWETIVNQVIQKTDNDHENVISVDWHQASEGQSNYIGDDGVHLSVTGAKKYSELIVQAIQSFK